MTGNDIRFIQFELWKDCPHRHEFCFNNNCIGQDKEKTLDFVLEKITSGEVDSYNQIGFIGGELFGKELDNPAVRTKFYTLVHIVCKRIAAGLFSKFYLTSSLVFEDIRPLCGVLDIIKDYGCLDNTVLCTSYDVKYRFAPGEEDIWKQNMSVLFNMYTQLNLHTEIMITQCFIDSVNSEKFDILGFKQEFHTAIDYLEPFTGLGSKFRDKYDMEAQLPGFFPKRASFLEFVQKNVITKNIIDKDTLFSKKLRCDTLYMQIDGEMRRISDRKSHDNRHGFATKRYQPQWGYIDYDGDMVDDIKEL